MKLNEIASVKTGLVLSRKEARNPADEYEYRQINLKSVSDRGVINIDELTVFYATEKLQNNYLTQTGDVIVKTSEPYTAVYITDEYADFVIPSHFVIIRADIKKIIPQYIAWYLNKDSVKKAFYKSCTGTLKQIKPSTIAETEIKLPDLCRQKQVVELYELSQRELKLLDELRTKKEMYYKSLINKINRM